MPIESIPFNLTFGTKTDYTIKLNDVVHELHIYKDERSKFRIDAVSTVDGTLRAMRQKHGIYAVNMYEEALETCKEISSEVV